MNEQSESAPDSKLEAALYQVARRVVQVARQTSTPVIVWEDGEVQEIPCDRLDALIPTNRLDSDTVAPT